MQGFRDPRIQWAQEYRGTGVKGRRGAGVQEYRGAGAQGYRGAEVQEYKGAGAHGHGAQKCSDAEACVRARVRACVRACVHACVQTWSGVEMAEYTTINSTSESQDRLSGSGHVVWTCASMCDVRCVQACV